MNIIAALKTRRLFRRKGWPEWHRVDESLLVAGVDLLKEDWEVKDDLITITSAMFWDAANKALRAFEEGRGTSFINYAGKAPMPGWESDVLRRMAEHLGFVPPESK